ncbi:substrate-binding domain-containing protein [Aquincola sp. MAHUQ-54]|uniref:Substrate-binding domain-containing protein n=1 Tax=Aquincola agrisoli TaxID=3119538 RepID=A0AAW9QAW1_9BURK
MLHVSIQPQWHIRNATGQALPVKVLALLSLVEDHGSLSAACTQEGGSYRHAWKLLREAEAVLGAPLLAMQRGKGSVLTPLARALVWADRRVGARLSPVLESLASELEAELHTLLASNGTTLRLFASHGFAVEALAHQLEAAQLPLELKYCNTEQAAAAVHGGSCDVAGLHLPLGPLGAKVLAHHARWLRGDMRAIHLVVRRQGLMVAAGNPKKVYAVDDLARPGLRFINRERGSGTRLLLELLLAQRGLDGAAVAGYEQGEHTHAAVAAYVASGMADVAFGVETAARRFGLEFIPVQAERYFLACKPAALQAPLLQALLAVVRSDAFRAAVEQLPGYEPDACGNVTSLDDALVTTMPRGTG